MIILHQSKRSLVRQKREEVGSGVVNSMRSRWLLLFFHDDIESFRAVRQLHSEGDPHWMWSNSRTVISCACVHVFNPSVICFLLPSHEYWDFSSRLCSLMKDTAVSCIAHPVCVCSWEGEKKRKTKTKVTQQQSLCVNKVRVTGELPLHNSEWQGNLIYTSNLMCLERIIMSIQ